MATCNECKAKGMEHKFQRIEKQGPIVELCYSPKGGRGAAPVRSVSLSDVMVKKSSDAKD